MLAPKAVVFATSKAYLLDIEAMLGAEGYRLVPSHLDGDGWTKIYAAGLGRFAVTTRHSQGCLSPDRDRVIDQLRSLNRSMISFVGWRWRDAHMSIETNKCPEQDLPADTDRAVALVTACSQDCHAFAPAAFGALRNRAIRDGGAGVFIAASAVRLIAAAVILLRAKSIQQPALITA